MYLTVPEIIGWAVLIAVSAGTLVLFIMAAITIGREGDTDER